MTTESVSKGCFVFKPSTKKKKMTFTAADYFGEHVKDSKDSKVRFETYQTLWQQMKSEAEKIQEDLNRKVFDSLLEFIRKSHSNLLEKMDEWRHRMRATEIPAAALVLGVNVPDHAMTFQILSEQLRESITPYVVSLEAKECQGVKHILQKVFGQLLGHSIRLEADDETDVQPHPAELRQKKMLCSLASLADWYTSVKRKTVSVMPGKKRSSPTAGHLQTPPVVIIFKDLESFHAKVLQDFIVICSQYVNQLPFTLIFGIATSSMTIHKTLPHSVSSLLCIELFQSVSCTEHLAAVIDKLVLTHSFPFRLNGKMLQVLITVFLYHDFSVRNFIKGLQLCIVEHFYSQPLSILCCSLDEAENRTKNLTHEKCEMIRQLPSFMRYVENQEPEKQVELLTSDTFLKKEIKTLLRHLHNYHENYIPVLRCLHALTTSLPKFPLGKQIRELHSACLERNVWESEEYTSAFQLLRMMAKDELVAALQKCCDVLKTSRVKQQADTLTKVEEFIDQLQKLDKIVEDETVAQKSLQKKTDLYQLQKTLLEMKDSRKSKKLSKFETLRLEVLDFIDSIVRMHLKPPEVMPLYEVVYFSGASTLRKHLNAAPRIALHTALNNPYYYLENEALKSEAGTISNSAPDICIAYKLHLECGRLINLCDWLEAFATVVAAASGVDPESDLVAGQVDETIHARFIRAVSELEFLGFVKPTKQKTDHVARLTWGGC
ncbi:origin recognition complex subunit 3 [Protopterus annectens]|uniref:origin recognition complex subunit 3 n=1 Tax=Protopterus annectens TaxID=7888 RepID=UPI001CFA59E9|nr:origin recognition complex subunit 3 [Protopterus annectens]